MTLRLGATTSLYLREWGGGVDDVDGAALCGERCVVVEEDLELIVVAVVELEVDGPAAVVVGEDGDVGDGCGALERGGCFAKVFA